MFSLIIDFMNKIKILIKILLLDYKYLKIKFNFLFKGFWGFGVLFGRSGLYGGELLREFGLFG